MASPDPEAILNVQDPEGDDDRSNDLEEYFDAEKDEVAVTGSRDAERRED